MKSGELLMLAALAALGYFVYTQYAGIPANTPVLLNLLTGGTAQTTYAAIGSPALGQAFTYNGGVFQLAQTANGYYAAQTS